MTNDDPLPPGVPVEIRYQIEQKFPDVEKRREWLNAPHNQLGRTTVLRAFEQGRYREVEQLVLKWPTSES